MFNRRSNYCTAPQTIPASRARKWMAFVLLSAVQVIALVIPCVQSHTQPPMHVLFFLIDDLGYADVGYHGNNLGSAVSTPTIDELSSQGVRLENYYVNQLCSPTRSSLLSGRYAYSIRMNGEVIVDGSLSCMPTSVATIADRLSAGGWATSAFGKWDLGMASWGCTPTCRGFEHFYGFYNAGNNYFTHIIGNGLDFRDDVEPVTTLNGTYFTEAVTANAVEWITSNCDKGRSTFAYVAHESNHGPMQVPMEYIDGHCANAIPVDRPARRIVCGMMRAVDESLDNLTAAYKELGVWENTIVIMSTDNGGETDTGGNNYPLRGNKATMWEGGVRGVGWVSGGYRPVLRNAVSTAMIHVSDWYPTIIQGIAGLTVGIPADGTPKLDGINAWPSIMNGVRSNRTEMLLWLNTHKQPPDGAIRVGKYKLIQRSGAGKAGMPITHSDIVCTFRDGQQVQLGPTIPGGSGKPGSFPYAITNATSMAWCPMGWVRPPETGKGPRPPPDVNCPHGSPCVFPNTSYENGGIWLFDVEADPSETTDLSGQQPDTVQALKNRLDYFINLSIPQDKGVIDPNSNPEHFNGVWTPWLGDPNPSKCTKPPLPPGPPSPPSPPSPMCGGAGLTGDAELVIFNNSAKHQLSCVFRGWCSGPGYSGPPLSVNISVDGTTVAHGIANSHRVTAGNHGFQLDFDCEKILNGKHKVEASCKCSNISEWHPITTPGKSPACTVGPPVHEVPCYVDQ